MTTDATDDDRDDGPGEFQIKDTDDYNQARRLKTIHQARDDVRKARKNVTKGRATTAEHEATHQELAQAVATYGHEVLPLMEQTNWDGDFDDGPVESVYQFIYSMGHPDVLTIDRDLDYIPTHISMLVYGKINKFVAEIGLGADFDDDSDEWEV